jgi:predicted  nucleic acid-binding Zn-ribbon protein
VNPTIERLVALQDLLQLKRDLGDSSYEAIGFPTGGEEAIRAVEAEIESLRREIEPRVLKRYETIAAKYERPLVPARKGTCYGCFVRFPTAQLSQVGGGLVTCENCGRLLYEVS